MSAPAGNASAEEGVKTPLGAIVGIVTDSAKLPVAHATVTAVRADGGGIRATVSNSDGVYSFADLTPGAWSVSVESDGQRTSSSAALAVLAGQATRADLALNGSAASRLATAPAPVPAAPPTAESLAQAVARIVPEALQAPPSSSSRHPTPWADVGYVGWMNGTSREHDPIFDTNFFTPEIRLDMNYLQSGNHPIDHTIVGSTEEFRSGEFQIEQVSFGGDFHWHNVRARFLSMFGEFATTTPRNDASSAVGQWDLQCLPLLLGSECRISL